MSSKTRRIFFNSLLGSRSRIVNYLNKTDLIRQLNKEYGAVKVVKVAELKKFSRQ